MNRTTFLAAAIAAALSTAAIAQAQQDVVWRDVDPENVLVIDTTKGRIVAELYPSVAPRHVERIKALTRQGLYDNRAFFRVIDDFMAQTGDPEDTGRGGSALPDLKAEFTFRRGPETPFAAAPSVKGYTGITGALPVLSQPDAQMDITADGKVRSEGVFCPGVLGMARAQDPDSANSQFFLMRQKSENLAGRYTAFGKVIAGLDVVRAIKPGDPQSGAVPEPQDRMNRVRVMADIPADQRPQVRVRDTTEPGFAAYIARERQARGAQFDICDLDIAAAVQ